MKVPTLVHFLKHISYLKNNVDAQALDNEWRHHVMCSSVTGDMSTQDYWRFIFREKSESGKQMYPALAKVISVLFSFPFSNATVERVFSQLNLIKRDQRTALKHETLLSLMTSKLWLQQKGSIVAAGFDPPKEMLKLHEKMISNLSDGEVATLRKKFLEEISREVNT